MECAVIELDALVNAVILPEGIRFYNFGGGEIAMPMPNPKGPGYLNSRIIALERISDGKIAGIEIPRFSEPETRGCIFMKLAEIATGVDLALEQLKGTD